MEGKLEKILLDPFTVELFNIMEGPAWLVGGFLRDRLLSRECMDRDFVVPEKRIEDISLKIKKLYNASKVEFKGIIRLVTRNRGIIDLAPLKGPIQEDLLRRDFTINAMAMDSSGILIDPSGGHDDLKKGLIRAVRVDNLLKDPVRMLRAWRFASELGFRIEEETMRFIAQHRGECLRSSPERITIEFFHLLDGAYALQSIEGAIRSGPCGLFFPLEDNEIAELIKKVSQAFEKLKVSPEIGEQLRFWPQFSLSAMVLFFGLVMVSGRVSEVFVLPRVLKKALKRFIQARQEGLPRKEALFDFFENYHRAGLMYLLLEGADELIRYYWPYKETVLNPPLRGDDLIRAGYKEGPEIRAMIQEARRKAFERYIHLR